MFSPSPCYSVLPSSFLLCIVLVVCVYLCVCMCVLVFVCFCVHVSVSVCICVLRITQKAEHMRIINIGVLCNQVSMQIRTESHRV